MERRRRALPRSRRPRRPRARRRRRRRAGGQGEAKGGAAELRWPGRGGCNGGGGARPRGGSRGEGRRRPWRVADGEV